MKYTVVELKKHDKLNIVVIYVRADAGKRIFCGAERQETIWAERNLQLQNFQQYLVDIFFFCRYNKCIKGIRDNLL